MKPLKASAIVAVFIVTLLLAACTNGSTASRSNHIDNGNGTGFAVLELFTSEGCSSCPPADALLARIQKEAANKPIYLLAYHVDYWNRLGWKDVFSQPQFSKRQYQYSRQLPAQVYTPQLVINGKKACIGSEEATVRAAIKDALSTQPPATLELSAKTQGTKLNLDYRIKSDVTHSELLIALIQKHATSKVKAGENKGRTLEHVQIVRQLQSFRVGKNGSEQIDLPAGYNSKDWEIIGLIQNAQTGAIEGAARTVID
jgi:hypothetical protein